MKKFYAIAALATVLVGCAKEVEDPNVATPETGNMVTLRASVDNPDTKMQADNVGAFAWQKGDVISVLNNSGEAFDFSTTDSGTTVDFTGTFASGSLGDYAMYPKHDDHEASGSTISFHLPTSLDWATNTTFMPMLGKISDGKASFKAVGGVLKLVCYNIPSGAVLFQFSATNKQINGEFVIDGSEASPAIETDDKAGSNNETKIDFTGNYSANKVFYIPLPTGTIDGFTVSFFDSGANELFSKTTTANLVVGRNKIILGPALNCNVIANKVVTNDEIVSDVPSSYNSGTIKSASGDWPFSRAMKQTTSGTTRMQIAASEYLQLPSFASNISTVTLHSTGNGGGGGFNGTIYFSETASVDDEITSQSHNGALGTDIVINVPSGYKTGYLIPSGAFRVASITVVFEKVGSFPSLTPANGELTIPVGSLSSSTTLTYANRVDEMEIGISSSESWLTPTLTGTYPTYTLTATASGANNGAADRTATITLSAAGVKKTIDVTQTTCLVPNPTVTVLAGDAKFSASWTGDEHATSYVAYLHTATTATPATGGTDISASITESAGVYSITDYAAINDQKYYLYVKVNGVAANYEAPTIFVESSFTPEEAKGTSTNPYSVAEAKTIISSYAPGSGGASSVYTEGIVVAEGTLYNSTKITYYISDDGTSSNQLQVFRGKNIGDTDFSAVTDLEPGDRVVVYGQLYNYSGTPEINTGNYLYSLTKVHKLVLDPNTDILMGGAANSVYTMTITTNYAWTAEFNGAAAAARGTSFDVLDSSDAVIDGTIAGSAGTTTIKFKAKGDGNGDGSTVTTFGTITFSDGTLSSTKNIKQSPKASGTDYSTTYTTSSNVTVSSDENKNVSIGGNSYPAKKSNKGSSVTITIPANTTTVHLFIAAWNKESQTVTVTGGTISDSSISADSAIAGTSGTYTLAGTISDYYRTITPTSSSTTSITITAASSKRIVVWGVNEE